MAFIAWPQALKSDEKHIFFLAPHGAPAVSWYSFHSVNHTWKSCERFRITYLHTDPVFEECLLPDFRLFSKCLCRKTHLSPAPVVVHVLSRIQKSCKEYLRLWTMTFGVVTKSKTSRRPHGLPWRRRLFLLYFNISYLIIDLSFLFFFGPSTYYPHPRHITLYPRRSTKRQTPDITRALIA